MSLLLSLSSVFAKKKKYSYLLQINELTTAADSHRLNILLEIAAVKISEEEITMSKKSLEGKVIYCLIIHRVNNNSVYLLVLQMLLDIITNLTFFLSMKCKY